jgi:predicted Zn-dependent protease with MMP-like domain
VTLAIVAAMQTSRDDRHGRHRRAHDDPRRRPAQGWRTSSRARFERLVDDAVADLPPFVLDHVENVAIVVAEVPDERFADDVLLGLYEGVPRTERGEFLPPLPDRITLYRRPLEARAHSRADLHRIVLETLVHEIAHHVGIDDDRLDELGWG